MKKTLLITGVVAQLVSIIALVAAVAMYWKQFKRYYNIAKKIIGKFAALLGAKKKATKDAVCVIEVV